MKLFDGDVAVITGAGSGIGEATAKQIANEGGTVVLVGRTLAKLERVANEINAHNNNKAFVFACDVTKETEINELRQYLEENFDDLTIIVNNAGFSTDSTLFETSYEKWQSIQDVNLNSVFLVSKIIGQLLVNYAKLEGDNMKDRAIINVSSLSGHKPGAKFPHYSSAKAAVLNLTKGFANEVAPYGIRVNSVSPGYIETDLTAKKLQDERIIKVIKRHTALKRVGTADEVANAITFLASDKATYITGIDLLIDGGWLIT